MLMIPTESEGETSTTKQSLVYSISEDKIYNNIQLPVHDGERGIVALAMVGWPS